MIRLAYIVIVCLWLSVFLVRLLSFIYLSIHDALGQPSRFDQDF